MPISSMFHITFYTNILHQWLIYKIVEPINNLSCSNLGKYSSILVVNILDNQPFPFPLFVFSACESLSVIPVPYTLSLMASTDAFSSVVVPESVCI